MSESTAQATQLTPVSITGMRAIGVRPSIVSYIKQLWRLRSFIHEEAKGKAYQNARGQILGKLWILIEPFLNAAVYLIMFGMILHTDRGIENFLGYVLTGSIVFTFLRTFFAPAGNILRNGSALISSFTFPRATLVLSFCETLIRNTIPSYLVLMLGVMLVGDHALPNVHWLFFPLAFLIQIPFGIGLAFLVAGLTSYAPDLKFIWNLISRFWFLASGVFFSVSRFVSHPFLAAVMESNPAYVHMNICRDLLLYNTMPSLTTWLYVIAWAIGLLPIGFLFFWLGEERYGAKVER